MSRKHYVAVAAVIASEVNAATDAYDSHTLAALDRVARELCRTFMQDNDNFNSARFLAACGF